MKLVRTYKPYSKELRRHTICNVGLFIFKNNKMCWNSIGNVLKKVEIKDKKYIICEDHYNELKGEWDNEK